MAAINLLTGDVFEKFGNRKRSGRLSLLVDMANENIYAVPIGVEHIDFVRELIGRDSFDTLKMRRYIPVHVDRYPTPDWSGDVNGLVTGVSGMEISYGARHTKEDLRGAHQIVRKLIEKSNIEVNLQEDKVIERYSI
ncbi:MAG: hypothetical protein Q8Q42_04395 [Nanoarchaeota archaeon]|nr:hypothetical protein [Nanoarchaeota archaeon]